MFMVIASCAIYNSQNKHFKSLKIPPFATVILAHNFQAVLMGFKRNKDAYCRRREREEERLEDCEGWVGRKLCSIRVREGKQIKTGEKGSERERRKVWEKEHSSPERMMEEGRKRRVNGGILAKLAPCILLICSHHLLCHVLKPS